MHFRKSLLGTTALAAAALMISAPAAFAGDTDTNLAAAHAAKKGEAKKVTLGSLEKRVKALEKSGAARSVSRSKKTMKLTLSGKLSNVVLFVDDGNKSRVTAGRNTHSGTDIILKGTGKITDDISVLTYIEFDSGTTQLSRVADGAGAGTITDGDANGAAGDAELLEDKVYFKVTSKTFGSVWVGHLDNAANSNAYGDLLGTQIFGLNGDPEFNVSSETYKLSATGASSGVTVGSTFDSYDGGENPGIRYDTPKFAGFQAAISRDNDDDWDLGLRWAGAFGGVKALARLGYHDNTGAGTNDQIMGSGSILFPFGLGFTVAAGKQDNDGARDDAEYYMLKVGYRFKALELGETRISLSFQQQDDDAAAGDEAEAWVGGIVQVLEPLGAEVFAAYSNFDLDRTGLVVDDVDQIQIGGRFRF